MSIDTVLNALDRPRKTGRATWRAKCPACGGKNGTKLAIRDNNGVILLKCFGGCSIDEVVGALGLKLEDLMPPKESTGRPARNPFTFEAIRQLAPELNVAWVLLTDVARGRKLTEADRKRAGECGRKVANLIAEIG